MSIENQSVLTSNHLNWELTYEDSKLPKEPHWKKVAGLVISTLAWPILFLGGAMLFTWHTCNYAKARWNQYKVIDVLSSPKKLREYAERRSSVCDKQIESLKAYAVSVMEKQLKSPDDLAPLKDSWDQFYITDFFQKANIPNTQDKFFICQLEQVRVRINFLMQQKLALSNPEDRLDAVKKIAEMSFIKNAFKRQESKEWAIHSIIWMCPLGFFLDLKFNPPNDRATYEGNKNLLLDESYEDLVDAHNKLIRKNNFLVPFIQNKII